MATHSPALRSESIQKSTLYLNLINFTSVVNLISIILLVSHSLITILSNTLGRMHSVNEFCCASISLPMRTFAWIFPAFCLDWRDRNSVWLAGKFQSDHFNCTSALWSFRLFIYLFSQHSFLVAHHYGWTTMWYVLCLLLLLSDSVGKSRVHFTSIASSRGHSPLSWHILCAI